MPDAIKPGNRCSVHRSARTVPSNNNAVGDPSACPVGDCWRNDSIAYPFPGYAQTPEWRDAADFSVNTALNYII